MARITINTFGGIQPSVDPRNLPPDSAQVARNLDLRWNDFRPLRAEGAPVQAVPSGTISVHRTPSGTWLHATTDADFVDGQDDDGTAERVYVTGRAAYPEVWQAGGYRRLGVPRPPAAPTVTVNEGDEFSTDELGAALRQILDTAEAAAVAVRTEIPLGTGTPGSALLGAIWLSDDDGVGLPSRAVGYCVPITLGPIATVAASDAYLLDPQLGGRVITYSGTDYWMVSVMWQARGYSFDAAAMATAFGGILNPPANTSPVLTTAQANEAASRVAGTFSVTRDPAASYIEAVNLAQQRVIEILNDDRTDSTRAYALVAASATLNAAVARLQDYYTNLNTGLRSIVEAALSVYAGNVTPAVLREFETRFYRFTYVTDRGEESAPSDPSVLATLDQNDSAAVSIAAPTVASPYGPIAQWRLYRSSTTQTGQAWQFVAEVPIGTLTYTDTKLQEELDEVLVTETWEEPRADLFALAALPNGILVGLAEGGRRLCFCEPGYPYAWPREYEIPLQYPGVGIGVFGQTAVVPTTGFPYYVSGADSASMSAQIIEAPQACVSKRSIVGAQAGVFYASPDGICLAGPGGSIEILTLGHYSPEDWRALGLSTSFAAFSEGVYRIVTEN